MTVAGTLSVTMPDDSTYEWRADEPWRHVSLARLTLDELRARLREAEANLANDRREFADLAALGNEEATMQIDGDRERVQALKRAIRERVGAP